MKDSKLVLTLNTLSKEDLLAFHHFLRCKLFNKREDAIRLLDYLRQELKTTKAKLNKELIFKELFPEKSYSQRAVRDMMAYLSGPLNQFLVYKKLHAHREDELIALCKAFRERHLFKQFETTTKKVIAHQRQSPLRDSEYHYRNFRLEQEKYYSSTQKGRADKTNLAEVAKSLDISYFAHQSVYNISYNFRIVDEIIEEVKQQDLLHIPAISIYYYCYLAQVFPENVSYFKALRNILITNVGLFRKEEMKDIYLLAINIAIKRNNQGHRELIPDLLELYQSGIDQKILLNNNVLSRYTYKNAIAVALTQKRFAWIEDFMAAYTPLLETEYRDITYQYNLAVLHFEKKEFEKASSYLLKLTSNDDVYINIDTKILLARIYYKQNNITDLMALIESFRKVLSRKKKILGYLHKRYSNFLICLNKLVAHNPYDKAARLALLEEIESIQPLAYRSWFVEQLS